MKKLKRKYIVATAVLIFSVAVAGMGAVYAATDGAEKNNPMNNLVAAIASKFNLNAADVQAVFDEQKTQMETERKAKMAEMETKRQAEFETRLSGLVTAGKLTQTQADAIKAKKAELKTACDTEKTDMESMKGKTEAERQAAMEAQKTKMEAERNALKQWAADNGISEEYISMVGDGMFDGRGTAGKVTANNGSAITMTAKQPGSDSETVYTVTAADGATIKKVAKGADGQPVETAIALADITMGDTVSVRGTVSGTAISATEIKDGFGGEGFGRGGHGFGGSEGPMPE